MKLLLSFTLIVSSFVALANDGNRDSIVQIQKIGEKEFYYLVDLDASDTAENNLHHNYSLKYTNDGGETFRHQHLDSINEMLLNEGNLLSEINIFFVDESLGFIYGYITGFAHYPFLFKTEDAGKTWNATGFNTYPYEDFIIGTPLRKSDFFMFNKEQGILLCNWGGEPILKYKLTNDGGETWESKSYELNEKDFRILNAPEYLSAIYSVNGEVTIIIQNRDFDMGRNNKVAIIRSSDFGETFANVLKIE